MADQEYVLARADESSERERLRALEAWLDPIMVYDTMRLAWPQTRPAVAAAGVDEADLALLDAVWESPSTWAVTMTLFAAWARKQE
jgi:hypothetical protein